VFTASNSRSKRRPGKQRGAKALRIVSKQNRQFEFMARQIEGTVKHWRGEFGFVLGEDGADYFLHSRECLKSGIAIPKSGDRIAFTPERGPKGLCAIGVKNAAARGGA
jgi:cold shock CspA family protein